MRLLGAALAVTAALVFLQTVVLRAIPYDASWFGAASSSFRASFMIADVVTVVALIRIGRDARSVYPFTALASILVTVSVVASGIGWLVSASSLGGIEPMLTFGASLLIAFTLAAVLGPIAAPDRRRNVVFAAALVVAVIVLGMRLVSAASHAAPSMILAWLRWAFAVAQPASLAALAFLVARSNDATRAPSDEHAAAALAGGSYRAAGEAAFAAVRPELAAPGPAIIDPMRRVSSGIEMHRAAFIMRVCLFGALFFVAIVAAAELAAIIMPLFGAATATVIALGVTRQRALASFDTGSAMRSAQIAFFATVAAELAALLWVLGELAFRLHMGAGALSFVVAGIASALGILFVSRAHERAGDLLSRSRLASHARWTQGVLVLAVTSLLATVAATAHVGRRPGADVLGVVLAIGFGLLMCVSMLAVVVIHVMTLNEAHRALKDRLEMAQNPPEEKA